MSYYAVANGKTVGVFTNWNECKQAVHGFPGAIYKKFDKKEDADAFITSFRQPTIGVEQISYTPDFIPDFYIYTDGACSNNGRRNSAAGIGIYFGENDARNRSVALEGKQTNNSAELHAVLETYYIIENDLAVNKKICIVTDSEYVIKCVTSYGEKCHRKNWTQSIPNRELVKKVFELYNDKKHNIQFLHIRAHTTNNDIHSIGNHYADLFANMAIGCDACPYQKKTK